LIFLLEKEKRLVFVNVIFVKLFLIKFFLLEILIKKSIIVLINVEIWEKENNKGWKLDVESIKKIKEYYENT
jgi:hypothetical protein